MLGEDKSEIDTDRRQYRRVKVLLDGRLMLSDRSEFACRVADMSPGSVAFSTGGAGRLGERVIAYVDHVGRLDGRIARVKPDGFALRFDAPPNKHTKLVRQLTWLEKKHALNLPEDRRYGRIEPRNQAGVLIFEDGRRHGCRIVDLSLSGAAVETDVVPPIGAPVSLGSMRGRVARHFEGGISIEFTVLQRGQALKPFLD